MIDLGTVFGLAGLGVALASLLYVRTQAEASRIQAQAAREQAGLAQRLASLEVSLRLSERTFEIRRDLMDNPVLMAEYYRKNPGIEKLSERVGGMAALMMMRKMLDTFQDIYLLRREGIVTDAHWANWIAAFRPFARIDGMQELFENATSRGIYAGDFQQYCRAIFADRPVDDPRPGGAA